MKKIIMTTCLFLSLAATSWAALSSDEARSIFEEADAAYKAGRYEDAIRLYEGILDGDLESGAIHYNLGNAYFKNKQLGKAILEYERARRLIPRDVDLKANYKYALSLIDGKVLRPEVPLWEQLFIQHNDFYSLNEVTIILFVLAAAAGMLYLLMLYLQWPRKRITYANLLLGVLFAIYSVGYFTKENFDRNLAVAVAGADAKFEPRTDATTYFDLTEGNQAVILGEEDNWVKIERLDRKAGWVPSVTVERIEKQ